MEVSMRSALQRSTRIALRSRLCPGCSSVNLLSSTRSSQQNRQFTTTPRRNALGAVRQGVSANIGRNAMTQMNNANANQMKSLSKEQIPDDIGLFPQTFVSDAWHKYLPLLRHDPRLWLRIQWMIFKQPVMSTFGAVYNLYWNRRKGFRIFSSPPRKQKPIPIHFTTRIRDALALHKQLNTAMAQGDRAWLRDNCCSGLADKACSRIDRRAISQGKYNAGVTESWELVRYGGLLRTDRVPPWPLCGLLPFTSYKLMNDVTGQLPMAKDTFLRQVIVRIKSTQRYNLYDGQGPQTRTVTEHIVLQKIIWQGEDEDWKVWGTVNPSTIKQIKAMNEEMKAENSLMDRVRAMMPSGMGGGSGMM